MCGAQLIDGTQSRACRPIKSLLLWLYYDLSDREASIMTSSIRESIAAQAEALGPVLHAGMATSLVTSRGHTKHLRHEKYPHLLPLHLRAEFREHLETETLPNGWVVGGDSKLMGQLILLNRALGLELRFVKERRATYPGGVPHAGKNPARRKAWANAPMDSPIPGLESFGLTEPTKFLLCWDLIPGEVDSFSLRIVHTVGAGRFGSRVPLDLILEVQDGGSIFTRLAFRGSEDNEDFFGVEIAEEENGNG